MNRHGHPTTLVPKHPGNGNAVKAGVFSVDVLAPRIEAAERLLAAIDPDDLISELLRSELARLVVVRDAMDQTLEEDGVRGRGGQPRNMLNLRLRLTDRLLKVAAQVDAQRRARPQRVDALDVEQAAVPRVDVLADIARRHQREAIDLISPNEFDPSLYLAAVIESDDRAVPVDEQIRARDLLTRWRAQHHPLCACFSTRAARDGAEFRAWMDELRDAGLTQLGRDPEFAGDVRAIARGDRVEPWFMYAKTSAAVEEVVHAGVTREIEDGNSDRSDALNFRLWQSMLSPDPTTPLRRRLKAFDTLAKANGFRQCTCGAPESKLQLAEQKFDAALAYIVKLVAGRHYRSAAGAVEFPDTYLAVRDAIDAAIRSSQDADGTAR